MSSTSILVPLLLGAAFGWLLQRTGLSRYQRIVGIFRFRDLTVLKFLLTALVTAAVGIRALETFGLAPQQAIPVPATYVLGNLVGGVIFGVGMALSGFCPGTVAAGAGEGRLDYLIPGGLGLYTGAILYGLIYERVMPSVTRIGRIGRIAGSEVTLPALARIEPWLAVLLFAEIVALLFYMLRPKRDRFLGAGHR